MKTDIIGRRFGRLIVTKHWKREKRGTKMRTFWLCDCDCKEEVWVCRDALIGNATKSCGCWNIDAIIRRNTKHGLRHRPEYKVWIDMKQRCTNPKNKDWRSYGCRGITVSKEWLKFENFFKDMGPRPKNRTLDRINNELGYSKENCRWSTAKQQANNKRTSVSNLKFCDKCGSSIM